MSCTLDWYLVTLEGTEDASLEKAKPALKAPLEDLIYSSATPKSPHFEVAFGEQARTAAFKAAG